MLRQNIVNIIGISIGLVMFFFAKKIFDFGLYSNLRIPGWRSTKLAQWSVLKSPFWIWYIRAGGIAMVLLGIFLF